MNKPFEIRWHGRGGQGAKTAALLFGDAAMATGKYIQAFPEYGPERMGAPVQAFNRLSDERIHIHSGIKNPDIVVVLDETLMKTQPVVKGLGKNGILLVNTKSTPEDIKKSYNLKDIKVYTIDASGISKEAIGKEIPNTPMLGALVRVSKILDFDSFIIDVTNKLKKKFRDREKLVDGNVKSIKRAYKEVL
ncbi:2-oxoacid:acceptor oxidoreductase family protein [candidate division WOR-3 bacterium]|nr:2-oxoacid:acceptor oxidoreductase family protein [candidate division WOR-3 bacterium]